VHNHIDNSLLLCAFDSLPITRRAACLLRAIPHAKVFLWGLMVKFLCVDFCHKVEISFPHVGK
jgi:hypothetical protein